MRNFLVLAALCLSTWSFAQTGWTTSPGAVTTTQKVGIKTSNPQADLAINGQYVVVGGSNHLTNLTPTETSLELQAATNTFFSLYSGISGTNYSSFYFVSAPQYGYAGLTSSKNGNGVVLPMTFSVGTGAAEKMRIATNGNVGIGTSDPQTKLAVDGTITAKEVIVTTADWPDYVFEDSYELMPLDQLAESIAAHGKLPGVPSAAELEKGGVSLGEMQKSLMEKVEELTLYMLQLKRENDTLKSEVGNLKTQMSSN